MKKADTYKQAFDIDKKLVNKYFSNIEKSEQQKMLEELLKNVDIKENAKIGDIGSGGGKCSYHLNKLYPSSKFYLLDYNEDAINIAKELNPFENFNFVVDDIYNMPYEDNYFDLTNCLVVISFIEDAQKAIDEIIRVTKKGGDIFISALINFDHDVDLLTKVLDKTRESAKSNLYLTYNTFSTTTFEGWMKDKVSKLDFHRFDTTKDFIYNGKGINTYTVDTKDKKLQLAGGMLLNWGFIHAVKK